MGAFKQTDKNNKGLEIAIKRLAPEVFQDGDITEAASNLLAFMELLIEIDREHGITRAGNEAQP